MITYKTATINDLELLRHWDAQPHVAASDPNEDWDWEDDLSSPQPWREQLIAMKEGLPLGFLQIMDPRPDPEKYWGDVTENIRCLDIWIGEKENLSHGYGTQMMQWALEKCFRDPEVVAVQVDPMADNTRAHKFYKKNGFHFVEERWFGPDFCHVYRINRSDRKRISPK